MLSLNAMLFNSEGSSLIACKEDGREALSLHGDIVRKMSPQRTLFILVLIVLDVDQMGGHISVDASVNEVSEIQRAFDRQLWSTKELTVSENAPSPKNNHARETKQDSEKMTSAESDLVEVVAELRREVRALKSEVRGVQASLSECAAARVDARRAENDHVRVQWMQREMAETRQGRKERQQCDFEVYLLVIRHQVRDSGVGRRVGRNDREQLVRGESRRRPGDHEDGAGRLPRGALGARGEGGEARCRVRRENLHCRR